MSFHTSRRLTRRGLALAALGVLSGTALLAGCGGGSNSNSSNSPEIRAVNAISNGGNATISVNGTQIVGSQNYFTSSSYQAVGSATSSVNFTLSGASSASFSAVSANFQIGNYYSAILVGRADITTSTDPRYPTVIVTADTLTTSSSNQAEIRIVHAAPDAGPVDILVNGTTVATGTAYKSVSTYLGEPSGNVTIQVSQTGSSTVLVTPQTISLASGHVYTVYVVEPTVSPTPVYGIQDTDDTSVSGL